MTPARFPLRILVAPNAFKESLDALQAAEAIAEGILAFLPTARICKIPIADGGDGTLEVVVSGTRGRIFSTRVLDPLGRRITAEYGITGDGKTAIIEMSRASGLALVPPGRRNPMRTTSFGTGELIRAALDRNVKDIILGIGGSATVDGGIGALQALGVRFLDRRDRPVGFGGEGLLATARIELASLDPRLRQTRLKVACDVNNPMVGSRGAAPVFGPQKGATPRMVRLLDQALSRLAALIRNLKGVDVSQMPGGGAAGGISGSLCGLLSAKLKPGSDLVFELVRIKTVLRKMDLVITGEGRIDSQTPFGKGPGMLAKLAKQYGVPVVGLAGSVGEGIEPLFQQGFSSIFSIVNGPLDLDRAMQQAGDLLRKTSYQVARMICMARDL
jgi:glycerate kinase